MISRQTAVRRAGLVLAGTFLATAALAGPAAKIPSEALMVISIDVAKLVDSDLYKKYAPQLLERWPAMKEPGYVQFKQQTGFNAETDLKTVTMGFAGDVFSGKPKFYAVLEGKYDQAKLESFAKTSDKFTVGSEQGILTLERKDQPEGEMLETMGLVDGNTLVMSAKADFPALLAAVKGSGSNLESSAQLGPMVSKPIDGQVLLALVLPPQAKDQLKANPQMSPLANIQTVMLTAKVTGGVDLALQAASDTAETGKQTYDALNGFLAMGRMMSGQNPDLAKVMTSLKLEQDAATSKLTLSIPAEDVDKLMAQALASMPPAGAAPADEEPAAPGAAPADEEPAAPGAAPADEETMGEEAPDEGAMDEGAEGEEETP